MFHQIQLLLSHVLVSLCSTAELPRQSRPQPFKSARQGQDKRMLLTGFRSKATAHTQQHVLDICQTTPPWTKCILVSRALTALSELTTFDLECNPRKPFQERVSGLPRKGLLLPHSEPTLKYGYFLTIWKNCTDI